MLREWCLAGERGGLGGICINAGKDAPWGWSCGNAFGAWLSTMPIRSASGVSTSQTSGSVAPLPGTVDEALAKMRGLLGGAWEPSAVARGQERLGWADIIRMHGYVIVQLGNRDARTLKKFMRLDWGHDGFCLQTGPSDSEFRSYCGVDHEGFPDEIAGTVLEVMARGPRDKEYEDVTIKGSMQKLIDEIDARKHLPYDIATWNCNHFANRVVDVLTSDD